MWNVGFTKRTLNCVEPRSVALSDGKPTAHLQGVGTPLYVRAMVVQDPRSKAVVAYVCAELSMITSALRQGVLEALAQRPQPMALDEHGLMLTATHTHSGPCGFSQFLVLNTPNLGFSQSVFTALVDSIALAIEEAMARAEPARLRIASVEIPEAESVAFNRSLQAFTANEDVSPDSCRSATAATRRTSVTLRADAVSDDRALGLVNWFAVHGTSVHEAQHLLHSDNKGIAALKLEHHFRTSAHSRANFTAIFAQEASGDVSPTHGPNAANDSGLPVGPLAAANNGGIQARYALVAFERAAQRMALAGPLGGRVEHADLSRSSVSLNTERGVVGGKTRAPHLGIGFLAGTDDGHGPAQRYQRWLRKAASLGKRLGADPSLSLLDLESGAKGRVLGWIPLRGVLQLLRLKPATRFVWAAVAATGKGASSRHVLPIQIVRIGELLIAALPAEPTTTAGRRLRRVIERACPDVQTTVINGYANAYSGYVATPEEYDLQHYEGGGTQFGRDTLLAYQAILQRLVSQPLPTSARFTRQVAERQAWPSDSRTTAAAVDPQLEPRGGPG